MGTKLDSLRVDLHSHVYASDPGVMQRIATYVSTAIGDRSSVKNVNGYTGTIEMVIKQKDLPSSIIVNGAVSTAIMTELRQLNTAGFSTEALEDLREVLDNPALCTMLYYITYTRLNNAFSVVIRF